MTRFNILVVPYMLSRGERTPLAGADPARFQRLMHRIREQMQFAEQLGYSGFCMTEQHMQIDFHAIALPKTRRTIMVRSPHP